MFKICIDSLEIDTNRYKRKLACGIAIVLLVIGESVVVLKGKRTTASDQSLDQGEADVIENQPFG